MKETISKIEKILDGAKKVAESGEIYDHGYPEMRLVPADHTEMCEEGFSKEVIDEISEIVASFLDNIYERNASWFGGD